MRHFEKPVASKQRAFFNSELNEMAKDKSVNKKHWRHKPYKCDFGGGKNDRA